MAISLAAITGAAVPGFTTPTYTPTPDTSPAQNGKQWAITALGGTQANVDLNTVSKPFTISFFRPAVLRSLPQANPVTGVVKNIPVNTYKMVTRKGAVPSVNQVPQLVKITTTFEVPAGVDTYEPEDLKAAISAHIGALSQQSSGIADTLVSGVL